ncbi:MAG: hypothetical protein R3F14_11625 [Polyangiaceae bacterium]
MARSSPRSSPPPFDRRAAAGPSAPRAAAPAEHAGRVVELLSAPTEDERSVREAHARRHLGRRRPQRAVAPLDRPARSSRARGYLHEEPTSSAVYNAFLRELDAPARARLACADISRIPEPRLALALFEAARLHLPRMMGAVGELGVAFELADAIEPAPDGRDPWLYTRAAVRAGGDLGAIAGDLEDQRILLREGRGDRTLARCMLAALAGALFSRAATLLGPHVLEDLARTLEQARSTRRRPPARRAQGASALASPPCPCAARADPAGHGRCGGTGMLLSENDSGVWSRPCAPCAAPSLA